MHQNPFTPGGYDYSHLERQLHDKADRHEIHSLRSTVDCLERAVRELRSEIDGLRNRCEEMDRRERERPFDLNAPMTI